MAHRPLPTHELLQRTALRMFAASSYEAVTVAAIAREAGVSHMTFFRHFPTKESVVVGDVFDPRIAAAVAAQPPETPPLHRAVRGLLAAMESPQAREHLGSEEFRTRIELVARTPALRSAARAGEQATEDAIARALATAAPGPGERAAAGALMGAATALLLDWAAGPGQEGAAGFLAAGLRPLLEPGP
ncbi:TetR/AcrR family transcriptional regulator [Brachybacterium sp. YJGR34]|uniref:TetR/AcrR family transcriptional regulator n=1 Tax=Brachybacterium sp. YJGR34 TaxID=2059911 RepID=UPI001E2CBFB6|nr:TetR/AcrR family transcriptional regulator [Brachybacterium sp. YJGR34]